jgi:hypothetical protein
MKKALSIFDFMRDIIEDKDIGEQYKIGWYIEDIGFMVTSGHELVIASIDIMNVNKPAIPENAGILHNHKYIPVYFIPKSKSIHKNNEVIFNAEWKGTMPDYSRVIPNINKSLWRHMYYDSSKNTKSQVMRAVTGIIGPTKNKFFTVLDMDYIVTVSATQSKQVFDKEASLPYVVSNEYFIYIAMPEVDKTVPDTMCPDISKWLK